MLVIECEPQTLFNEATNEFVEIPGARLRLEHSLLSLSKWEAKWEKPFLTEDQKTAEQLFDYIEFMSIERGIDRRVIEGLSPENLERINTYIAAKATATTFSARNTPAGRSIVTSEVIYGWMVAYQIPWEAQKWHLNRLLTLIQVVEIQQNPKKHRGHSMSYEDKMRLNLERQGKKAK